MKSESEVTIKVHVDDSELDELLQKLKKSHPERLETGQLFRSRNSLGGLLYTLAYVDHESRQVVVIETSIDTKEQGGVWGTTTRRTTIENLEYILRPDRSEYLGNVVSE